MMRTWTFCQDVAWELPSGTREILLEVTQSTHTHTHRLAWAWHWPYQAVWGLCWNCQHILKSVSRSVKSKWILWVKDPVKIECFQIRDYKIHKEELVRCPFMTCGAVPHFGGPSPLTPFTPLMWITVRQRLQQSRIRPTTCPPVLTVGPWGPQQKVTQLFNGTDSISGRAWTSSSFQALWQYSESAWVYSKMMRWHFFFFLFFFAPRDSDSQHDSKCKFKEEKQIMLLCDLRKTLFKMHFTPLTPTFLQQIQRLWPLNPDIVNYPALTVIIQENTCGSVTPAPPFSIYLPPTRARWYPPLGNKSHLLLILFVCAYRQVCRLVWV